MTRSFRGFLMLTGLLILATLTAWIASPGFTAEEQHTVTPVEEVTFQPGPPTLPEGAQIAVLLGHPAEEGAFVIRFKFPAGFEVPPHRHSKEEHLTVLSGRFGMSTGEVLDKTGVTPLMPGGFVRIPAGHPHFAWAEEVTVVQLNGMGPFDIIYVDEADDPRIN
ncbi:cupin domain-containing protein [Limimaricola litoreus]|uniref:Cupin domain-containing protein n=1 Tax=Limimaricola litoreus TaxID=2955316 RepID=A0A9X2JPS4_9RHOB|nr:cupin domain-containing protein [Limimaricola litoreus]MCP1168540.1 cupin domain-containing protein [Limimaricola litoreus]